jgi:exonuclease SbcC
MILKRLYLENFLAHENTEINFAPYGITAFIGENGAGKSSILEAISYALIGKSNKGSSIRDLVKWGKNEAKVILEINKDGIDYKIERIIKIRGRKASTEGNIYKKENGKYIHYYHKDLNKNIPKITGLTSKVFQSTILVRQGDIEGLINLQPSKRAEIIQELLDITIYDLLSKKFGEIRKEIQNKIEAKRYFIENIYELQVEIEELEKEEKILKEKLNRIKEKKENIENLLKNLKT